MAGIFEMPAIFISIFPIKTLA